MGAAIAIGLNASRSNVLIRMRIVTPKEKPLTRATRGLCCTGKCECRGRMDALERRPQRGESSVRCIVFNQTSPLPLGRATVLMVKP